MWEQILDLNMHMEFFKLINIFYCVCGMHYVILLYFAWAVVYSS